MLDDVDIKILETMSKDSRIPMARLAVVVGMSPPSVSERVRRLEERGVITGYSLKIDPRALGYQLQAIVRVRPLPGKLQAVQKLIAGIPEFCECDKVTGDDCFVGRLQLRSIEQLDQIVDGLTDKAETNTSIVKMQVVERREPPFNPRLVR